MRVLRNCTVQSSNAIPILKYYIHNSTSTTVIKNNTIPYYKQTTNNNYNEIRFIFYTYIDDYIYTN